MTMYVSNQGTVLTNNELGSKRFELASKGQVGSIKVLPVDVALRDGFQRAWAAGDVIVSLSPTMTPTITSVPASETAGADATTATAGNVKQAAAQANSTATDVAGVVADFNALLAKLRAAGIIAT